MSLQIEDIIKIKWETKSQVEIDAYKSIVREALKLPYARVMAKEVLLLAIMQSARDYLDGLLFTHYIHGRGKTYNLTDVNLRHILTGLPPGRPVDLSLTDYTDNKQRKEWLDAFAAVRADRDKRIDYSGTMNWSYGGNALGNHAVIYKGVIAWQAPNALVQNGPVFPMWMGKITVRDRFDLDPHWDWSPANLGGRSEIGERRTRIGYILDLGTDFDITGPEVLGVQVMFDRAIRVTQLSAEEFIELTLKAAAAP